MYFAYSKKNARLSNEIVHNLGTSYVWREKLGGKCNAIRESLEKLGSPAAKIENFDDMWFGYVLPKGREVVVRGIEKCGQAKFLRLMIINDCDSCLVSGSSLASCKLRCRARLLERFRSKVRLWGCSSAFISSKAT